MKTKGLPRGLRNHNPLNIRKSDQLWQGQTGNDGTFCIFLSNAYGYRAAFRLLRTYRVKYHRCSVRTIIERWAPPNENATQAYINQVCKEMDVPPHFILNIGSLQDDDAYWACELVRAMALVENGNSCADLIRREEIRKGYSFAFAS